MNMIAAQVHRRAPSRTIYSRDEAPLDTIRFRDAGNGQQVRMIKIRMDGPTGLRWILWAKWWWERNRGPVPSGFGVTHADGNLLNDDPANFVLLSSGQRLALRHRLNPEWSNRTYLNCRRGTAAYNIKTGIANRRRWLSMQWYGVDFDARIIHNRPRRLRWMIYRDAGLFDRLAEHVQRLTGRAISGDTSSAGELMNQLTKLETMWRWVRSATLGWPGVSNKAALVLTILTESQSPLPTTQIIDNANKKSEMMGWGRLSIINFYQVAADFRRFTTCVRRGRSLCALYGMNHEGRAARLPGPYIVAVRGKSLRDSQFSDFARRDYPYESCASSTEQDRRIVEAKLNAIQSDYALITNH